MAWHVAPDHELLTEIDPVFHPEPTSTSRLVHLQMFRMFAILNVGRRTVPSHDLSSLVPQRHEAAQKPPVLPVSTAEAQLLLGPLTTGNARGQSSLNSIQIIGMLEASRRSIRSRSSG